MAVDQLPAWAPQVPRPSAERARVALIFVGLTTAAFGMTTLLVADGFTVVGDMATASYFSVLEWSEQVALWAGFSLLLLVASAVTFLAWLSRVVENVPALGGGTPLVGPRGAILWWFAPGANLFQPYRIVADVWRRLAPTPAERGTALVVAWWVLWVVAAVVDRVAGAASVPETQAGLNTLLLVMLGTGLGEVISGLLLLAIIREIERRSSLRLASAAPGPPAGGTWGSGQRDTEDGR